MGSGTTLVSALRLRRSAYGCEFEFQSVSLSLRRICSDLVHIEISVSCVQISVDLPLRSMDRSGSLNDASQFRLVQRERSFHFVGELPRQIVFKTVALDLNEAWRQFRNSPMAERRVLFIIKTETEIFLAQ
jgi:hypothetical protein